MPRHYSKVLVQLPESPTDPPEIVVRIDCDVCGVSEFRTHITHLGTLARVLGDIMAFVHDDGHLEKLSSPEREDRQKVLDYLDRRFPEWKGERIRRREK